MPITSWGRTNASASVYRRLGSASLLPVMIPVPIRFSVNSFLRFKADMDIVSALFRVIYINKRLLKATYQSVVRLQYVTFLIALDAYPEDEMSGMYVICPIVSHPVFLTHFCGDDFRYHRLGSIRDFLNVHSAFQFVLRKGPGEHERF